MSKHQDDEGASDSDGSSDCDRALYGSPTLPTIAVSSSGPGAADGMESFFQAFPTDWLSPSDEQKRISRDARRRSATFGASPTLGKEEERHDEESKAKERELPPIPTLDEAPIQMEVPTLAASTTPAVPDSPSSTVPTPIPAPASAVANANAPQAITTTPVVVHPETAAATALPRTTKAAPAALLSPPRSPPRLGYLRSHSMQAVALPPSSPMETPHHLPSLHDLARRTGVPQSASLYNMRNGPLSAPAHKTSFPDLGGRARMRHAPLPKEHQPIPMHIPEIPKFRTDIFPEGGPGRLSVSVEEEDGVPRPPPFFYARSATMSETDHLEPTGEAGERESFYAQSSRGSVVDMSDALSMTSAGGKKNKLKMAMSKSIPRAISKRLLRKQSSGELSSQSKLVADESFSCLGGEPDTNPEDIVGRQNAGLKTVPDSFKRLFTPPNSAPPVPPLPSALLREHQQQHGSLPALPSQAFASPSPRVANTPIPPRQFGSLPRLPSQISMRQVSCETKDTRGPVRSRTPTPDLTPSRESFVALPPVNIGAPVSLLPAAILREDKPLPLPKRKGTGDTIGSVTDCGASYSSCSPTVSTACSSVYGSSSAASSEPSIILRTPDMIEGPAGGASVFVSGEQTPVRRRRDGRQDFGHNKIGAQDFYARPVTTEPESYEDSIVQKRDVSVLNGRAAPTRSSTASSSSSLGSEHSSDGSDLGLDGLMFPMPPARTVVVDAASGQGWQEVSPLTEYFPPSSPASVEPRNGLSVLIHTASLPSGDTSPASPHTALPSPTAQPLSQSQVLIVVRSILPEEPKPESPPSSPCPLVTVTMPSVRCMLSRSAPPSPGLLSPVPPHKPRRAVPTPSEARTLMYKTDVDDMLPAKLLLNCGDTVAIDAPRWSDLVSFCWANEDTIIREAVSASPKGTYERQALRELDVRVCEVGEYNDDGNGHPDINDPKYFRVQMTLTVRSEVPAPLYTSPRRPPSPASVYSRSSRANSAREPPSPSFTTPALSQDNSSPPSMGDSSEPASAFSDSSCPPSALISAVSFQLKDLELTPLTTPDGSLLGLSNLDVDAPAKMLVLPATASSGLASPTSPTEGKGVRRGRTRRRMPPASQVLSGDSTVDSLIETPILHPDPVVMPTVLGQIITMAAKCSYGEGVARI
ncbi:hypothetical protein AURDEDRAFT_155442 [Auricularia subglabra TFB-10046 SS5]|nr:hypothetical protein AURDEDRAFT_155442 [Auricularia subglabra TFB-10046 SS5]